LAETANQPDLVIETGAIRESYLQAAEFIGREAEFGQLVEALVAAKRNQGSAWLVGGESGVGKSRLLDELRSQALVDGALVLQGQAISERVRPYRIWYEVFQRLCLESDLPDFEAGVLKALVPDIGRLLARSVPDAPQATPQAAYTRLLKVIAEVVQRHEQPLVIILEDLQWAGDESLAVLERLCQDIDNVPVLLLASYRDDERPRLPQELPQMQQLKLPRLSASSITALSESMLGTVGRQPELIQLLEQETEGNTFFIVEVVRVLAEEAGQLDQIGKMSLPRTVFAGGMKAVVERRLARVPATAYPLLQVAAIAGRQIDIRLLGGLDPGMNIAVWLDNCAAVRVLEVHEGRWRFAHDKLREGLLLNLQADERRHLHRQVAEAIEQVYAADLSPLYPRLAYHCSRVVEADDAGNDVVKIDQGNIELVSKAIDYLQKAGEQARGSYANREAIDYFQQALRLLEGASPEEQLQDWGVELTLQIRESLGDLLELIGKYETARTVYQDTVAKVAQRDRIRGSRLHRKRGNTFVSQHQYEVALEEFDKAQYKLGQKPAKAWPEWWQEWVQVQVERMWVHYYLAQVGEMTDLAQKIRPVVEQYGTPTTRVKFFDCLVARNNRRDRYVVSEETVAYARAQLAAKQELGILDDIAYGRFHLAFSLLWHGKLAEAEDQMRAALTLLEQSGHSYMQVLCLTYLTVIYRKLGQVEEVQTYNAQSLTAAVAGEQLNYIAVAKANLAWLAWHEGNLVEVEKNGLAALELWKQTSLVYPFQWMALWSLIGVALAQNRRSKAIEYAASLVDPTQQLLPDTLTAEIEGAIEAWNAGKLKTVDAHLNQAIELAQDLGFL
jgi:tetratricopeptide (TPR) repeat protein